jgi:hypothetical protein
VKEPPSTDREARFSLYDFQSDSETEDKLNRYRFYENPKKFYPRILL